MCRLSDVMQVAERNGILILQIPGEIPGLDGFAAWAGSPYPRPVIALLGGKAGISDQFHTWRGNRPPGPAHSANGFCEGGRQPSSCVRAGIPFATRSNDRGNAPRPITLSNLAQLKPRWKVSLQMLIRRASDLKLATPNQYRYLNQQVRMNGWTQLEPGDDLIPRPKASAYAQDGRTSVWETSGFEKDFIRTRNP